MNTINDFINVLDESYENGENILVYVEDGVAFQIFGPDGRVEDPDMDAFLEGATPSRHFVTINNGPYEGMRLTLPTNQSYAVLAPCGEPVSLRTQDGDIKAVWLTDGTISIYDPCRHVYSPQWGVWLDILGVQADNVYRPTEETPDEVPEDFVPGITVTIRRDVFPKEDIKMIKEAFGDKIKAFMKRYPSKEEDGVIRINKNDDEMTIQIDQIWVRHLVSMLAAASMTYGKIISLMAMEIPALVRMVKSFEESAKSRAKQLREFTERKKSTEDND